MRSTLPGKSLEAQFDLLWQRFVALSRTRDSLSSWQIRLRRWLTPINISFIVPISDEPVCDYLTQMQRAIAPYMSYTPQPTEKLHITLYQVGYLRAGLPFRNTWTRKELDALAQQARQAFAELPEIDVRVGPINAFPNVAIAEVHDEGQLRLLERAAAAIIPEARRQPPSYPLIPHITLGYFGDRPAAPIARAMEALHEMTPMPLRIDRAALTLYYHGLGRYRSVHVLRHTVEDVIATLPLKRSA